MAEDLLPLKASGELYLEGQWRMGSGAMMTSLDPVYQTKLWTGKSANDQDLEQAMVCAHQAQPLWAATPLNARMEILTRYQSLLKAHLPTLIHALSEETGKPLWEAQTEVQGAIQKLEPSLDAYHTRTGSKSIATSFGKAHLDHRPIGVLGLLGPFNFPLHIPNAQMIPALIAGNAVLFKPSEHTPRMGELLVRLMLDAGLPPGVLSLIQGNGSIGAALAQHPGLNGLFFTGSYQTGISLHQAFAGHPEKLLVLEMGGNNPIIAWDTDQAQAAAYHIVQSAFLSAGQRCICARRLILPSNTQGDQILNAVLHQASGLRIAAYDAKPQPFMGSLISHEASKTLLHRQSQLQQAGGKSLLTLKPLQSNTGLVTPGIIEVTAIPHREDLEIFGPLLQIIRVKTFEAAILEANATRYGLAASIFTDTREKFLTFDRASRAGVVNWNRPTTGAIPQFPFGGVGKSGNFRPSGYYSADACAYPVSHMEAEAIALPTELAPGVVL